MGNALDDQMLLHDDLKLKKIIRQLCQTSLRQGLSHERIKIWLNQFSAGPETRLALLIIRYLIYRTDAQIYSLLDQSLRKASLHFMLESDRDRVNWRHVFTREYNGIIFNFGPPKDPELSRPGGSGEIITRHLKKFGIPKSRNSYPSNFPNGLDNNEGYIMVDDGSFTGEQIEPYIGKYTFLKNSDRAAVVLGLAHSDAITLLKRTCPEVLIFYGELFSCENSFQFMCVKWMEEGLWPYDEIHPVDLYLNVCKEKAKFVTPYYLGHGNQGLLLAYEHGIPDNSLQLLWDKSDTWQPLIER